MMEIFFRLVVLAFVGHVCFAAPSVYKVGVGIADVTGPAAEINMMGYANPAQLSSGIHTRQYSRAFIIDDGAKSVVFVSVDCALMDQVIKTEVSNRLEDKYPGKFSAKNVILSGTHTHSGPGGYLQYVLFLVTSKGWIQQSFDALVEGIVKSIDQAQADMKDANIYYATDVLIDANINRSPASYLNNPAYERAKYTYNTDKDMVQLKFVSTGGQPLGVINWYAVHCTSMNNTNSYISSDNKGYAGLLFEGAINGPEIMPGEGPFVAAFASSNLGDVSPNTMGARCIDTGLPCDFVSSSCNGRTQLCIAFGPGKDGDMVDSTRIIGDKQFQKAWDMYSKDDSELEPLEGPVQFAHQFVDMTNYTVDVRDPVNGSLTKVKLCTPAMGYSFAAGTTDGPGAFDFTQGATSGNDFWNLVASALVEPSEEVKQCQYPKPVLLSTGEISWPYDWHPSIVETQILRIGQFLIAAVPGEFTTMAGRRLREALDSEAVNIGGPSNTKTVIAGLSNGYTHYITTFEEYQIQRYEGASTIYGPHTLSAYLDQYKKLTQSIFKNENLDDGPTPPFLLDKQISLVSGVVFDRPAFEHQFGDCLVQPYPFVRPGETVTATFVAGHPRNNLMTGQTFMKVEFKKANNWTVVRTDAHFDTFFFWERTSAVGQSEAHLRWIIPADTPDGEYRISHFGYYKNIDATVVPYSGTTQSFSVKA